MPLPSVTFSGTMADIQQQMLDFLGLTNAQYRAALAGTPDTPAPAPAASAYPADIGPIPVGLPPGAVPEKTPGATSWRDAAGNVLTIDWLANPPKVVPNPPRTSDGNGMRGDDFLHILEGKS